MSDALGPRGHPERCTEWAEPERRKRRLDHQASVVMWIVLGVATMILWWRT